MQKLLRLIDPGWELIEERPLAGGLSAEVTLVEVSTGAGRRKLIVRRHSEIDFAANPEIAEKEFRLLQFLSSHGVPAPRPVWHGFGPGFDRPCLVLDYVEGSTDAAPPLPEMLQQMAHALARVHTLRDLEALGFMPQAPALHVPMKNPPTLLHGDLWPGNVLWKDGEIAAVIDWEDSCIGDPLYDLANARMELFISKGGAASLMFTARYLEQAELDTTHLHEWDRAVAAWTANNLPRWGLSPEDEERIAGKIERFAADFVGMGNSNRK